MSSVEQSRILNDFKRLELKKAVCDAHLQEMEDQQLEINRKLKEEFEQLHLLIDSLKQDLKSSVEKEFRKHYMNIQQQKCRVSVHQGLISHVLNSPPDAAFFDMTYTLKTIVKNIKKDISELDVNVQMTFQERNENLKRAIESLEARRMADAHERCLVCGDSDTDNYQNADQSADQSSDGRVYSSTTRSASKRKILYPKIHFCGNVIWICSTCIIKGIKCNHCHEDLLDPQVDDKDNLIHTQLFTDLTKAEEREIRIILRNWNTSCNNCSLHLPTVSFCLQCECIKFLCQDCSEQHCKEKDKKHHIVKHIKQINDCRNNKDSSPCVVHTDKNSDFFCCIHKVPICSDCKGKCHETCTVNGFKESLDETKSKLKKFIEKLKLKEKECDDHLQRMKDDEKKINVKLTEEFKQLNLWIEDLENDLKKYIDAEFNNQKENINSLKECVSEHQRLISSALKSSTNAACFDMTQAIDRIIENDISKLKVNVQMTFHERNENLEKAIKILEAMRVLSRESFQGIVMENKNTLYSSARSVSGPGGSINITQPGMTHETENVVYVYTCTICHMLYVGQTSKTLKERDDGHHSKGSIYKHEHEQEHERTNEKGKKELKHFVVTCVRKDLDDDDQRLMMERLIILKLGTLQPQGLNERLPYDQDKKTKKRQKKSLETSISQTLD